MPSSERVERIFLYAWMLLTKNRSSVTYGIFEQQLLRKADSRIVIK